MCLFPYNYNLILFRIRQKDSVLKVVCVVTEGTTIGVTFTLLLTPVNGLDSVHSLAAQGKESGTIMSDLYCDRDHEVFSHFWLKVTTKLILMSLSDHYLEKKDFPEHNGEFLPSSQAGDDLHDGSDDGDHLDDENEEGNTSVDDQGYDLDTDPFIQHQGLPVHQQP